MSGTATPQSTPGATPRGIEDAVTILREVVHETKLFSSTRLYERTGVEVLLKRGDQQQRHSFKIRDALTRISALSPVERECGIVCASAGNHAQGVAYACQTLGVHGTVYLPSNTPRQKRNRIVVIGGDWVEQVIVNGTFDKVNALAQETAHSIGWIYVHPYDDPLTIAGQGTITAKLCDQFPTDTATVLVPAGGESLLTGIATWLRYARLEIRVIGAEPERIASIHVALDEGEPVKLERVDPFVDDTAVSRAGSLTFDTIRRLVDGVLLVPEGAVYTEILNLYQSERIIAEPAGALASCAIHEHLASPEQCLRILSRSDGALLAIVSGDNSNLTRYAEVMERSLRHEDLRYYFLVTFPQQPGALRMFLEDVLSPSDGIIHFKCTKKNNQESGPALVGIDIAFKNDIDRLRRRMEGSPLHVEEVPADSGIFRLLV